MSNSAYTKIRIDGLDEIRRVLRELPVELQDKVMRTALARAAGPLVSAAKGFARRRTGALAESIGSVIKRGKKNGSVYAVVGPMRGAYRGGVKLSKEADRRGADDPANYAHLVEFGHNIVAPIKGTSRRKRTAKAAASGRTFVAPRPFMRPALAASGDSVSLQLANGIADGVDRQLQRLVKNPKAAR